MSMRSTRFTSQPHTVRQFLYFDLMRLISFLVLFTHSHHAGGPTTRCTWLIRCKTAGASALVAGRPTISEHISHPTACVPDDATLVQSAVELHDDLAGAPVVDELEVADVSGLLHAQEELDKHLRSGESPATVVLIMPRSAREREDKVRPVQSTKKKQHHIEQIARVRPPPRPALPHPLRLPSLPFIPTPQHGTYTAADRHRRRTLLLGLRRTCLFPRFSALESVLRLSARTEMRTIVSVSPSLSLSLYVCCSLSSLLARALLRRPLALSLRPPRHQSQSSWYPHIANYTCTSLLLHHPRYIITIYIQ